MFSSTKDATVQNLQDTSHNARETAGEVKDGISATIDNVGHKVRGFVDLAGEEFSQTADTVTARIKEKPLQSGLIMLGIGFVLSTLFMRRS
ncbi:MAG TPA: hypothetical protein VFT64_11880 [Rickettsiales bacterium]|nr:hypothetical protein [Rickettsiales bacterium]